jgi:hypothetical protein
MDLPQRHREHGVGKLGKFLDVSFLYAFTGNSRLFSTGRSGLTESLFMVEKD